MVTISKNFTWLITIVRNRLEKNAHESRDWVSAQKVHVSARGPIPVPDGVCLAVLPILALLLSSPRPLFSLCTSLAKTSAEEGRFHHIPNLFNNPKLHLFM